jgi:uncharacterized SAM-binding protein YcdF (DUF218 family)
MAIVVLGAKVLDDGRPGEALQRRMRTALALHRAGVAPLLVLSGGGAASRAEADVMCALALAEGIPAADLLVEARSRDTVENALECARLLADRGGGSVVLVTDRWHGLRARLLFRLAGLPVCRVAAVPAPARTLLPLTIIEAAKLPVGILRLLLRRG